MQPVYAIRHFTPDLSPPLLHPSIPLRMRKLQQTHIVYYIFLHTPETTTQLSQHILTLLPHCISHYLLDLLHRQMPSVSLVCVQYFTH